MSATRYVLLNPGDVIQKGDEWYSGDRISATPWMDAGSYVGGIVGNRDAVFRRVDSNFAKRSQSNET